MSFIGQALRLPSFADNGAVILQIARLRNTPASSAHSRKRSASSQFAGHAPCSIRMVRDPKLQDRLTPMIDLSAAIDRIEGRGFDLGEMIATVHDVPRKIDK